MGIVAALTFFWLGVGVVGTFWITQIIKWLAEETKKPDDEPGLKK